MISQISKLIFGLGDNATVATILPMFGIDLSAQGLYNTLYKYGYVDLANEVKAVAIDEKDPKYTGSLSDIEWFTTQKDASGKDVQVPNVAKYWYVESGDFYRYFCIGWSDD